MTSNSKTAGRRPALGSFRLALMAGIGGAMLLAGGCAHEPIEPVAFENANVNSWFSGSADGGSWDRYEDDYKDTRAVYEAERYSLAVQRYRELARKGVPEAAYELGKAYRYGNGAPKDPVLAAQWMMAAVSKSHSRWPHASYHLGTMFLDGEGVPKDPAMARRLLQQALDHGYAAAALPLARIYAEGTGGMPRNIGRAEQLALQAAENGDTEAYVWLLRQYRPGGLLGENRQRAALLSQQAVTTLQRHVAETGDPAAMRDLALIYFEGLGTRKDNMTALNWLQRAAQADHPEYLVEVGEKILKGKDGYPAEPELGFKLLRTAAVRYRRPEAMALIAEAYGNGLGTPRDPAQEQAWYRRAVEAGLPSANCM
jgi:TPR repeat protein